LSKTKVISLVLLVGLLMALVFTSGCIPGLEPGAPADAEGGTGQWTPIIFLVLLFGIFYFLLIRPQRKKQKEHQSMMGELKRGDRVVTAGGIYGQIESLSEDSVVLKIESGTTIRIARASIAGVRQQ